MLLRIKRRNADVTTNQQAACSVDPIQKSIALTSRAFCHDAALDAHIQYPYTIDCHEQYRSCPNNTFFPSPHLPCSLPSLHRPPRCQRWPRRHTARTHRRAHGARWLHTRCLNKQPPPQSSNNGTVLCATQQGPSLSWRPPPLAISPWCTWAVFDVAPGAVTLAATPMLNKSDAWLQVPDCNADCHTSGAVLGPLTGTTTSWVAGERGLPAHHVQAHHSPYTYAQLLF